GEKKQEQDARTERGGNGQAHHPEIIVLAPVRSASRSHARRHGPLPERGAPPRLRGRARERFAGRARARPARRRAHRYTRLMARLVLATFGSLGDLHPYLAVALELQNRGHFPVIATHGLYRERVEAMGLEFAAVRPHDDQWGDPAEIVREAMDARRGSEVVLR